MKLENMSISDGYISSTGKTWKTPTQEGLENAITGAVALGIDGQTREEIIARLEAGKPVKWCRSWNFYYDHSYGVIGTKRGKAPVEMIACSCGHSVPRSQAMSASTGSSCPDCYDRMS